MADRDLTGTEILSASGSPLPKKRKIKARAFTPYIYVAPACILMIVFVVVPIAMSVYMSLFKIRSLNGDWMFFGIRNFTLAFEQGDFMAALWRTLGFGLFSVLTTLGFGLLLSFLVAEDKWLNFYRYVFYVPGIVSAVTMGKLWSMILDPSEGGLLNALLMNVFRMDNPIAWLNGESYTWAVMLGIGLIGCGGGMTLIVFTTALNNISPEIKESARLEGASNWCMATKISLPLISPVVSSWTVLSIIGSLKAYEFIVALTNGGPSKTTQTLAILLFDGSYIKTLGYGYRSAMGVMMSVVVLGFTGLYMLYDKIRNKNADVGGD